MFDILSKIHANGQWRGDKHGGQNRPSSRHKQIFDINGCAPASMADESGLGKLDFIQAARKIRANQRWNTNKESKDQTGASTLSPDRSTATLWKNNAISFLRLNSRNHLSILSYRCESRTLTADLDRRIQAI